MKGEGAEKRFMIIGRKNIIKRGILSSLITAAILALSSCAGEQDPENPAIGASGSLRVSSSVIASQDTRAYQESGPIESGHYYMTYHNYPDNETFGVCDVNFYDGIGVTTTTDGYELKWQEVGSLPYDETLTVFWLDNVPRVADDPDAIIVPFTRNYNPFVAGVFDDKNGTNDLLWGYQQLAPESTEEINIGIHH